MKITKTTPEVGTDRMGRRRDKYLQQVEDGTLTNDVYNSTGWAPYQLGGEGLIVGKPIPGIAIAPNDTGIITGSGEATSCIIFLMVGHYEDKTRAAAKHFNDESKDSRVDILNEMILEFSEISHCLAIGGVTEGDSGVEANNKAMKEAIEATFLTDKTVLMLNKGELGEEGIYAWTNTETFYWSIVVE